MAKKSKPVYLWCVKSRDGFFWTDTFAGDRSTIESRIKDDPLEQGERIVRVRVVEVEEE